MLFSSGIGASMSKATSGVIVGGQVLSLALTLLAIPVIYLVFDDLAAWARKMLTRALGARG